MFLKPFFIVTRGLVAAQPFLDIRNLSWDGRDCPCLKLASHLPRSLANGDMGIAVCCLCGPSTGRVAEVASRTPASSIRLGLEGNSSSKVLQLLIGRTRKQTPPHPPSPLFFYLSLCSCFQEADFYHIRCPGVKGTAPLYI